MAWDDHKLAKLSAALQAGTTIQGAARSVRLSPRALDTNLAEGRRLRDHPHPDLSPREHELIRLADTVDDALAKVEQIVTARWIAQTGSDWRAGQAWLSQAFRGEYLAPTRVEHTGIDGEPIQIDAVGALERALAKHDETPDDEEDPDGPSTRE